MARLAPAVFCCFNPRRFALESQGPGRASSSLHFLEDLDADFVLGRHALQGGKEETELRLRPCLLPHPPPSPSGHPAGWEGARPSTFEPCRRMFMGGGHCSRGAAAGAREELEGGRAGSLGAPSTCTVCAHRGCLLTRCSRSPSSQCLQPRFLFSPSCSHTS